MNVKITSGLQGLKKFRQDLHLLKKNAIAVLIICGCAKSMVFGQSQIYDDFEGHKVVYYADKSGVLDTACKNPAIDSINKSAKCALYVRNSTKKFDNIKMRLSGNLSDVSAYATYLGVPPKIKMKIFTTAPVGTLVEILLGSRKGNNDYPAGTNSQYQAYTGVTNAWEELEFKFSQIPQGSETSADQIDQVTLLFYPNSSTSDTYYFDDISGPPIVKKPGNEIIPPQKDMKKQDSKKSRNTSKKIAGK